MTLINVYENWLESVDERGFDKAFILLLMRDGYHDIHFTHGQFEFGKDFIAKKKDVNGVECQYKFQSKAGNIAGGEWSKIYSQLAELVEMDAISHPNFDHSLEKKSVLVTTGELRGKSLLSAKNFKDRCLERGQGDFSVWDRNTILQMFKTTSFNDSVGPLPLEVSVLLGSVYGINSSTLLDRLESIVPEDSNRTALLETLLHCNLIASQFAFAGEYFHALRVLLHSIRLSYSSVESEMTNRDISDLTFQLLEDFFEKSILSEFDICETETIEDLCDPIEGWPTYPLFCTRIGEVISILYLYHYQTNGSHQKVDQYSSLLSEFTSRHRGFTKPLSDSFAPSIVAILSALIVARKRELAIEILVDATIWVCDLIEGGNGPAPPLSTPRDEVEYIFGSAFSFISHSKNRDTLIFRVLADISFVLHYETYLDIINEFIAVGSGTTFIIPNNPNENFWFRKNPTISPDLVVNPLYSEGDEPKIPKHLLVEFERVSQHSPLADLIGAILCGDRVVTSFCGILAWDLE